MSDNLRTVIGRVVNGWGGYDQELTDAIFDAIEKSDINYLDGDDTYFMPSSLEEAEAYVGMGESYKAGYKDGQDS